MVEVRPVCTPRPTCRHGQTYHPNRNYLWAMSYPKTINVDFLSKNKLKLVYLLSTKLGFMVSKITNKTIGWNFIINWQFIYLYCVCMEHFSVEPLFGSRACYGYWLSYIRINGHWFNPGNINKSLMCTEGFVPSLCV